VSFITESLVEDTELAWLGSLSYAVLHGPEIAAGMPGAERSDTLLPKLISGELCLKDADRIFARSA
jgi:hypothetical protein